MKKSYIKYIPDKKPYVTNESVSKNRKEKHYAQSLILVATNEHGSIVTMADVRFYRTIARSYCCLWVHLPECWLLGGAHAGGTGYHRDSASLQYALTNAGFVVNVLEGRGSGAMESALLELGCKINDKFNMGLSNFTIINAHA